jgi:metal-responsive CopG/Arc/MetJ family transcriptional regulator
MPGRVAISNNNCAALTHGDVLHDHHEMPFVSMHSHLDHDNCMEIAMLRGEKSGRQCGNHRLS